MKRVAGIALCLCAIIGFLIFSKSPRTESATKNETSSTAHPEGKDPIAAPKARPRAAKGDASSSVPPNSSVVHSSADFAKGEIQNLVIVDGALQMGDDATYVPRFKPYKRFGIYISPEQSIDDTADTITPNFDVTPFEDNEVTLEIRTKSVDGNWSTWQEMTQEPNKPMRLEVPATAWQYRLNFFANDPAKSPKVRSVTMTPSKQPVDPDPGVAFSSNNAK